MAEQKMRAGWILLIVFLLLLLAVLKIDVRPIGPENSKVGLAFLNGPVHDFLGFNKIFYTISKISGTLTLIAAAGFALFGVLQLVQRRSLLSVDRDLLLLGGFYVLTILIYLLFEKVIINYRPVILDEGLEASFPSSHTMLSICLLMAAMEQIRRRMKDQPLGKVLSVLCMILLAVTVLGRLFSGVHWLTDIAGGVLLGGSLYLIYAGIEEYLEKKKA